MSSITLPDTHRAVNITDTIEITRYPESGFDPEPTTIGKEFRRACKEYGDFPAVVSKDKEIYSYTEYYKHASDFAKSLVSLGIQSKDALCAIGFNSPEYFFALHGCWLADAVPAGIYTTNAPDACYYVLNHCNAKICVCQGGKQAQKITDLRERLPNLKAIVVYWPEDGFPEVEEKEGLAKLYKWNDFLQLGVNVSDEEIDKRIDNCQPGSCATLIYTSGTTGQPKAVMCSHDGCMYNSLAVRHHLPLYDGDRFVSYLPLSHIAAQYIDLMLLCNTKLTFFIARPDALKGTLTATIQFAQPTIFVGVPRVYEKMMEKLKEGLSEKTGIVGYLTVQARSLATIHCKSRQFNQKEQFPYFYSLLKRIVINKIHHLLGFDSARMFVVSAAPVTDETLNFFASLDIPINDLLGQSEGTAPICLNTTYKNQWKIGSCGQPLLGVSMRIGEGNEIQYRGRNVMMGYLKSPEETLHTLDSEGWIHTGDMGKKDDDNFYYVTGRLKELIVTAGGENIPPVFIENSIIELCPSISNIIVVGDKRKFLSCLITLKCESDKNGEPTNRLSMLSLKKSQELGSSATTTQEVIEDPKWTAYIDSIIDTYNKEKSISNAQQIRKWVILEKDMSVDQGELTATMKLKRNVVQQHYSEAIEQMYKE